MNFLSLMVHRCSLVAAGLALIAGVAVQGQERSSGSLPQIVQRDGRYALMVDGAPYLMLGAQVNNSSAWPAMLPKVWPTVENTLESKDYSTLLFDSK